MATSSGALPSHVRVKRAQTTYFVDTPGADGGTLSSLRARAAVLVGVDADDLRLWVGARGTPMRVLCDDDDVLREVGVGNDHVLYATVRGEVDWEAPAFEEETEGGGEG